MNDIRNLLPDPKPTDTSDWVVPSSRDVRVQMLDGNRLHLTNNADNADSYVYTQVSLPAGQYRFGVEVSAPQGAAPTKLLRVVVPPRTELTPAIWDGQTGRVVTPPNTLPEDGELEFRVMVGPTTGCAIWVRRLFVMTDDDWQRMLDAGIAWFDGDSRRRILVVVATPSRVGGCNDGIRVRGRAVREASRHAGGPARPVCAAA